MRPDGRRRGTQGDLRHLLATCQPSTTPSSNRYMYSMVRRQHIDVQVHTSADATTVYALLRDGSTWPTWSPIDSFQLERAGDREPEGLGAIRIFGKGRVTGRDQIVGLVPHRRFSYRHVITVLSMVPLRRITPRCSARPRGESVQQPPHVRDNVRPIGPHRPRIIRSKVGSQSSPDLGAGARRMTWQRLGTELP